MAFLSLPDNLLQDAYNVHCFSKKIQVAHKTCSILVWGAEGASLSPGGAGGHKTRMEFIIT